MGKRALITGASSGLGKVFAEELAKEGYSLVLIARREEQLNNIKIELERKHPISVEYMVKDLGNLEEVKEVAECVQDIDLLVNNAGFGLVGKFEETDIQKELNMIDLNMKSLYYFTKRYALRMKGRGGGGVINIASTAAFQPVPTLSVYSATKAFVKSFSEAVSKELEKDHVHVMTLCPGPTSTEFFKVAQFGGSFITRDSMMMSPQEVVQKGLVAFKKKKRSYVAGKRNKFLAYCGVFMPKEWVLKITSKAFKK